MAGKRARSCYVCFVTELPVSGAHACVHSMHTVRTYPARACCSKLNRIRVSGIYGIRRAGGGRPWCAKTSSKTPGHARSENKSLGFRFQFPPIEKHIYDLF